MEDFKKHTGSQCGVQQNDNQFEIDRHARSQRT